jgi:hypothetical protein
MSKKEEKDLTQRAQRRRREVTERKWRVARKQPG